MYPFSLKIEEFSFGALEDINCTKMILNKDEAHFQWYSEKYSYHFKVSTLVIFEHMTDSQMFKKVEYGLPAKI